MNIYVGNLNYKVEDQSLKELFSEYGTVDAVKIISDKNTGRCKGFAFVEMTEDNEGQNAINSLNGTEFMGRKLIINLARPKN